MSPVNYFYDTEFLDDGTTIELISIGIVQDDGSEYYAVNSDMDEKRLKDQRWLCENVIPHLPLAGDGKVSRHTGGGGWYWSLDTRSTVVKPKWVIANEVRDFILCGTMGDRISLWADYAAYDHVALAQLWGPMMNLPDGIPMWTHDIQQLLETLPATFQKPKQESGEHNALADARHNLAVYKAAIAHRDAS